MGTSRIIGSLDNWLTSHGVDHPYIRPVIRNQVLLTLIVFVIGLAAAFASPWILWADAGIAVMTVIICSWTHSFLKTKLEGTVSMRMPGVILRFFLRLVFLTICLYAALIWGKASPVALVFGVAVGTFAPLVTFLWVQHTRK